MHQALVLLLDFDGVLRRWPPDDHALEHSHGLPLGSIRETAFEPNLLLQAITGEVRDEQWRAEVVARLCTMYPTSDAKAAVELWSASPGVVEASTLQLIKQAAARVPLILVTNATTRLANDLAALQLGSLFSKVVSSSQVRAAKPDARVFRSALQAAGCNAGQALYVDDSPINVAAANELGLRAHRFVGVELLQQFLQHNGILERAA